MYDISCEKIQNILKQDCCGILFLFLVSEHHRISNNIWKITNWTTVGKSLTLTACCHSCQTVILQKHHKIYVMDFCFGVPPLFIQCSSTAPILGSRVRSSGLPSLLLNFDQGKHIDQQPADPGSSWCSPQTLIRVAVTDRQQNFPVCSEMFKK